MKSPSGAAPSKALAISLGLEVAQGQIQAQREAGDAVQRLLDRNVAATAGEQDHQFGLVMDAAPVPGQYHRLALRDDGGGGLHEDHAFAVGLVAEMGEFGDVSGVVLADAEKAFDVHGDARWEARSLPPTLPPSRCADCG